MIPGWSSSVTRDSRSFQDDMINVIFCNSNEQRKRQNLDTETSDSIWLWWIAYADDRNKSQAD